MWCYGTFFTAFALTQSFLERNTIQGDSPVEENEKVFESIPSTAPRQWSGKLGDINLQNSIRFESDSVLVL